MRLIDADKLYEQTAEWEAAALENVKKHQYDDNPAEWNKWSMILAERTAFKFDIADAPTVESEQKQGRWETMNAQEPKWYRCSECQGLTWLRTPFCPECGAKMEEE